VPQFFAEVVEASLIFLVGVTGLYQVASDSYI